MTNPIELKANPTEVGKKVLDRRLVVDPSLKASVQLTAFKEGVDEKSKIYKEDYDLGVSKTEGEEVEEMRKQNPVILVGSVDATKFKMEWHQPKWYREYTKAATEVIKCLPLLDEQTKSWFKGIEEGLKVFEGLEGLDEKKFNRNVKNEIWKLVQAKGSNYVYGEKGLFNFLLAFNRVKNICPRLAEVTKEGFDLKTLGIKTIKLNTGKNLGKEKGKVERYSYMIVEGFKPAPNPSPLPPDPSIEPAPPAPSAEIPKYGTDAFYSYYEITDGQKEYFNASHGLFTGKESLEMTRFLSNPAIWEPLPGEGPLEQETRLAKKFNLGDGEIFELYSNLVNFSQTYPKFFNDTNNQTSFYLQSAYFLVSKRMVEYLDQYSGANLKTAKKMSLNFHQSILEVGNGLYAAKGTDPKMIAKQMAVSAEYMEKEDPNPLNTAKWKALKEQYQEKIASK